MWSNTSASNPASPTTPQIPSAASPTYRLKHQGRRIAQIVKLKPECVDKYKECHARVWPEVLKQIKDSNIEDCESHAVNDKNVVAQAPQECFPYTTSC